MRQLRTYSSPESLPIFETMRLIAAPVVAAWLFCLCTASSAGQAIYKCVAGGKVSYQADPCPDGSPVKRPTVEQLNRERRQRQSEAAVAPGGSPVKAAAPSAASVSGAGEPAFPVGRTAAPAAPASAFRCDGRRFCSQMTSCREAMFFLANCPGVLMDGDHDGIPCEDQWCH